jgi:histone-lysine N-methyltransferase SUV420H
MAPVGAIDTTQPVPWRPTSLMKACDLAKDDDFLSHILVERLSTGAVPLVVHKMDPSYRPPPIDPDSILPLVRRVCFVPRKEKSS